MHNKENLLQKEIKRKEKKSKFYIGEEKGGRCFLNEEGGRYNNKMGGFGIFSGARE